MSQQIPKNQFGNGAGKGDAERPVNRTVLRKNLSKVKWQGMNGTPVRTKGAKTTYKY
jgi:hypothetical protein